jgi:hypothetical protein
MEFRKPWNSLAETVVAARIAAANSEQFVGWCTLLTLARTFFLENPSVDFEV